MPPLRSSTFLVVALLAGCSGPQGAVIAPPDPDPAGPQGVTLSVVTETIPGTEVSLTLVRLPGGQFMMGSPPDEAGREEDEGPQRLITVEPFYIGMHEVLYDAWSIYRTRERDNSMAAPSVDFDPDIVARPSPPYEDPAHGMGTMGHPAVGMTQWAALQFARWLTEKTGNFYRLPTEAEWEYACRAGTTTPFSFGEGTLDAHAWHYGNSDEAFHPIGLKAPNPWGLFDMHGNVAEWTLDEYDATFYAQMAANSPWSVPTRLYPRTVRGGAYDDDPAALRCAARLESSASWKRRDPQIPKSMWWNTDSPFVGFRIVRPVAPPSPEEQAQFWAIVLGG